MSEQVTAKQVKSMPTIVSMAILAAGWGVSVDMVTFADGRVLVIGSDGIEMWPNERELMDSDPQGDFPAMIGFIEYEAGVPRRGGYYTSFFDSARFGRVGKGGLHGIFIESLDDGKLHLRDGRYLTLAEHSISLWDDDVDEALGLLGMMTWE